MARRDLSEAEGDDRRHVLDHRRMGIQVELQVGEQRVRQLPDPSGGLFDAAGDFDRLLDPGNPALGLLSAVDPHGETRFGANQMRQLLAELELLLIGATAGAERRGLMRLRAMAERCAEDQGELVFVGD
ncbi:hypothetical protein [Actinoplanes sp. NPDC020271]|uniref:hypothetical protein n=1 Tax=Actinoplanes sp. NPDC020271 TaxID=3363896 RepID=UPI00379034D0